MRAFVRSVLAACVVICAPVGAAAQVDRHGFGLADAIEAMRAGHPLLASARAQLDAAGHDVRAASLWTNPQLNVNYMRSFGFTTFDPIVGAAQVGITQFLELGGVPAARTRAATFERNAVQADATGTERDLAYGVWRAVLDLSTTIERRRVLAAARDAIARGAEIVRLRVNGGAAPDVELARISLSLADATSRVALADADIAAARGALAIAVGPRADRLRGDPAFDVFARPVVPPLADWLATMATRPDVAALAERTEAARHRIDVARRSVFPGIALYAGVAVGQGYGPNGERQVDGVVSVTVPLPVVDRGQGTIAASQARALASMRASTATAVRAEAEVRTAFDQVVRQRAVFESYRSDTQGAVARLTAQLEAAYREGRIGVFALVDGYESARDASLRAIELASGVGRAEIELWRSAGRMP